MSNINIIDDEIAVAELMALYLQQINLEAQVYLSGESFFSSKPEILTDTIIILDLKMPGMDGIEVIRQLAAKKLEPSLILVSGYDTGILHSAKQLAKAHNLRVMGSLVKPVDEMLLERLLKSAISADSNTPQPYTASTYEPHLIELQEALEKQQFILDFQPQVDVKSGEIVGAEALVRWRHPKLGIIYPNSFIPQLEKNGLIDQLTVQVIKLAIKQISRLCELKKNIPISVNVSAENIKSLSLPEYLSTLLQENQLDPTMLVLEVTETALMGELVTSLDILTRLRMKGFDLSIDDFGTGYSSLSHLHRIPFTELKIDQSFVKNLETDDVSLAIIKTCIMLGHELNMSVIAEGVETKDIYDELCQLGCDRVQGYYIARPMSDEQFINWLNRA